MQQRYLYQQIQTRRILVKTIFTDENGDQSTDHRVYKVVFDKTDQTFKKEFVNYLSKKFPALMFSVSIYDYEKPVLPAEALPDDLTLTIFPW